MRLALYPSRVRSNDLLGGGGVPATLPRRQSLTAHEIVRTTKQAKKKAQMSRTETTASLARSQDMPPATSKVGTIAPLRVALIVTTVAITRIRSVVPMKSAP